MDTREKKVTVYLTVEEYNAIKRYADVDGRGISDLLRYAIAAHIRRSKKRDFFGQTIEFPGLLG